MHSRVVGIDQGVTSHTHIFVNNPHTLQSMSSVAAPYTLGPTSLHSADQCSWTDHCSGTSPDQVLNKHGGGQGFGLMWRRLQGFQPNGSLKGSTASPIKRVNVDSLCRLTKNKLKIPPPPTSHTLGHITLK